MTLRYQHTHSTQTTGSAFSNMSWSSVDSNFIVLPAETKWLNPL
jgi:hypothetical protein